MFMNPLDSLVVCNMGSPCDDNEAPTLLVLDNDNNHYYDRLTILQAGGEQEVRVLQGPTDRQIEAESG